MFVITMMLLICLGVFVTACVTAINDIRNFDKQVVSEEMSFEEWWEENNHIYYDHEEAYKLAKLAWNHK